MAVLSLLCLLQFAAFPPFGAEGISVALAQATADSQPSGSAASAGEPADKGAAPSNAPVIPPGEEKLLTEMLGQGATLPGQCQFAGGDANGPVIRSTYDCPAGKVVFELRHPSQAPAGAVRTEQFAITLQSGSPPQGLQDALVKLIRSHESDFQWKWLNGAPWQSSRLVIPLVGIGLVVLIVIGIALRRRRSTKAT
jgi:hypothetical protein